ncbi:MAG: branched-chain amino acid ABC transporter substrate-binding protein [Dehalococcoidia bacterium]|nr:branched-chain amino acid ABC transporter substrate-binding protein [Dehalococcoidia bacterium]
MRLQKWAGVVIAMSLLGQQILAAGCANQGATFRGTFKIGLVAPFSGMNSAIGYNMLFAAKLAISEWNDSDRLKGYRIELLAQDDRIEAVAGLTQAKKMSLDYDVLGVVGHPSSASAFAAAAAYSKAGLAMITTEASADTLSTGDYPGVFRLSASDSQVQAETIKFISTTLKAQKLAVVADPQAEHSRFSDQLNEKLLISRMSSIISETLKPDQTDFSGLAQRMAASAPQVVVFKGDYLNAGSLLSQMRLSKVGSAYIADIGSLNALFLKTAGNSAEGSYLIAPALSPTDIPSAAGFVLAYRAISGLDPLPSAALTYDGVNLILTAFERSLNGTPDGARPDRQSVIQAIGVLRDYPGLSSNITFDQNGGVRGAKVYFYRITGLRFPGEMVKPANAS